jgi:hypothetical protein
LAGIKKYLEATGDTVAETASTATVEGAESKEGEKDGVALTEEKNEENKVENSSGKKLYITIKNFEVDFFKYVIIDSCILLY